MRIHLKPGKTAVIFKPLGIGAREHASQIPRLKSEGILFCGRRGLRLCVAAEYKHLGCVLQEDGGYSRDVASRSAIICSTAKSYSRKLLGNSQIPIGVRLNLASALIFSKGDYGVSVMARAQCEGGPAPLCGPLARLACGVAQGKMAHHCGWLRP